MARAVRCLVLPAARVASSIYGRAIAVARCAGAASSSPRIRQRSERFAQTLWWAVASAVACNWLSFGGGQCSPRDLSPSTEDVRVGGGEARRFAAIGPSELRGADSCGEYRDY